jgi:hypothetical protein
LYSVKLHAVGDPNLSVIAASQQPARSLKLLKIIDRDQLATTLAVAALGLGAAAAVFYYRAGLTLSHYDAKAHLVVARRVLDSLTPGWKQIGAVWLPLPHVINLLPSQIDALYRTGAFAVAVSVLSFAAAVYAVTALTLRATSSRLAASVSALVLALNPNLLYLQATPMTEPLLLGLTAVATLLLWRWIDADAAYHPRAAGWTLVAACLTRYEGWLVTALSLPMCWFALRARGHEAGAALRRVLVVGWYAAGAVLFFVLLSRITTGSWFVAGGFYQIDNVAHDDVLLAAVAVWWGTHQLTGYPVLVIAAAGVVGIAIAAAVSSRRAAVLIALSFIGAAMLPWYAFYSGHPFRVRYMIPMLPLVAIGAAIAVRSVHHLLPIGTWLLAGVVLFTGPRPFDATAPMILEAQLDRHRHLGRQPVVEHLRQRYDRQRILASMGSLAHVMQELSGAGLALRDFVHEGNFGVWQPALDRPMTEVGWVLMDEESEGGDMLALRRRGDPRFLDGFTLVSQGGGLALYRRERSQKRSQR